FFGPEFFERFFRRRQPREDVRSTGSGVIVNAEGYILTNNHVVENADSVEVHLSDDRKFQATIVGRDPKTDLAVLKIDASAGALPVAALGDSDRLRAGQWAIAIGNPFGLDRTVTIGHISATGRTHVGVATYEAFIQTDASINPGNSGGPLLNIEGKVVGINTAILGNAQGIGFAIPVDRAKKVIQDLLRYGQVHSSWIGAVTATITPEEARRVGIRATRGALVSRIFGGSPAQSAGLRPGDVITAVGDKAVDSREAVSTFTATVPSGQAVPLTVVRDGSPHAGTVRPVDPPRDLGLRILWDIAGLRLANSRGVGHDAAASR